MATIKPISTGEVAVSAIGAVTGTLDTSTITGNFSIRCRVRDLTAGKKIMIALEDTASATPFTDAIQVAVFHFEGTLTAGANAAAAENSLDQGREWYDIPVMLKGAANNKLRVNVLRIDAAATCFVEAWMDA
jgi:hypothetical protein